MKAINNRFAPRARLPGADMMRLVTMGSFPTRSFGRATIQLGEYASTKALYVGLVDEEGAPLAKLSVNLPGSESLPKGQFWAKTWFENEEIAADALASGAFRSLGKRKQTGLVIAELWEVVE